MDISCTNSLTKLRSYKKDRLQEHSVRLNNICRL